MSTEPAAVLRVAKGMLPTGASKSTEPPRSLGAKGLFFIRLASRGMVYPVSALVQLINNLIWRQEQLGDAQDESVRSLSVASYPIETDAEQEAIRLEDKGHDMASVLTALEIAGDGVAIVDADNRISYVNHAMINAIGVKEAKELIGRRKEDVVVGGIVIFNRAELETARDVTRRVGRWYGEISLLGPGMTKPNKLTTHLRALPLGGRVMVFSNPVGARQHNEERRQAERRSGQADKLEALGQMADNVAHDFNNLLGAILGFARFIVEDTDKESAQHRYAIGIVHAGNQAKWLVGQILAFSRQTEMVPEWVNLGPLIQENMDTFKAIVAPTTTLDIQIDTRGRAIAAQPFEITQLLINLIVNASEALNGNAGRVIIEVGAGNLDAIEVRRLLSLKSAAEPPESHVEIWTDAEGIHHISFGNLSPESIYLRLSIRDSGEGMTRDTASNIFTPFFTTKGRSGGTGLGLTVVRNIVTSHRGGLLLATAPGRGSCFDIFLPVADSGNTSEAQPQQIVPVSHRGSILLVDDSSHFSEMLMTALERLGYAVSVCDDPEDAIGYVEEDPTAWDLVITDQIMPRMSGTDLVAVIKKLSPGLPCIICTGYTNGLAEEVANRARADGLVFKPPDIGHLSVMVRDLIAQKVVRH